MSTGLIFQPDVPTFSGQRTALNLTVLSGGNNSGKSAVLKALKQQLGRTAYLVGPSRFYHIHQISTQTRDPNEIQSLENQFQNSYLQPEINHEQNFLDLGKVIANLSDKDRAKLFSVCSELIGSEFSLQKVDPENELSMRYIDMDGQSLGLGSTGTRLLMTLIGICLDTRFNTILIDEPEIGLSPKVQEAFASFLQNQEKRALMFPHLSNVYLATHSHLFLDRREPKNNFVVSKENDVVTITQTETIGELHRLQFNLLGNSLEKIFLPSAILITEGPSDHDYLKRVVELKFPNKRITVASGQGDVKQKVYSIKETLGGDLQKSPYGNRLFVVVDSVHPNGLSAELKTTGVKEENLIIWSKNGIEYLYPLSIMAEIFNVDKTAVEAELKIEGDDVKIRTICYKKVALAKLVVDKLKHDTVLPSELVKKMLEPLSHATS